MTQPVSAVVLDANNSWIRALFEVMPPAIRVRSIRIENPRDALRRVRPGPHPPANQNTTRIVLPGLRRFTLVSQRLVTRALKQLVDAEPIDLLVCTNPWHAPSFEATPAALKVYYVTDPFEHYAWPRREVRALEDRLAASSDLIVATSLALVDDFRARTDAPVEHLPNALSQSFIDALERPLPRPATLASVSGPIVGVIGRINDSYDWDLLEGLSDRLPEVTIVLVGPVMEHEFDPRRFLQFVARPNVRWVGQQPHETLPHYLATFDVCLNPLERNPWGDRRCPLRLFDYTATDAPILSTPIREAEYFGNQIQLIENADQGAAVIREVLGASPVDLHERRACARRNTWQARADQWVELIEARLAASGDGQVGHTRSAR